MESASAATAEGGGSACSSPRAAAAAAAAAAAILSVTQHMHRQTYLHAILGHRSEISTCSSARSRLCVPDELLVLIPREEA